MRIGHDLLGDKTIPDDAYYGVQTARALENLHVSGIAISQYLNLIRALAIVRWLLRRIRRASMQGCQQRNIRAPSKLSPFYRQSLVHRPQRLARET